MPLMAVGFTARDLLSIIIPNITGLSRGWSNFLKGVFLVYDSTGTSEGGVSGLGHDLGAALVTLSTWCCHFTPKEQTPVN